MIGHARSIAVLVAATLLLCCVLYPLALLAVGRFLFPANAAGSLVFAGDGTTAGSSRIARPLVSDGYFQPRPSAVSYNSAASGGSNWGASNVKLRDRAARIVGPIVRFQTPTGLDTRGKTVQENIDAWFQATPGLVDRWVREFPTLAEAWFRENAGAVAAWEQANPAARRTGPPPDGPLDPVGLFFARFARTHPDAWPAAVEGTIRPVRSGPEVHAAFFDLWLRAHPEAKLEAVPADLVTASGSGLDPHITLANARYQSRRVVTARAAETGAASAKVQQVVEEILTRHAALPLGGLGGGEPLVNVLEVNLALDAALKQAAAR
jgi:K+-transporting ATPase ATPase C chain